MLFFDGPCKGRRAQWAPGEAPPLDFECGTPPRKYTVSLSRSAGGTLVYVLKGGPNEDEDVAQVQGRRDVFKAFRRLTRVLAHDSPRELGRVVRAGKRARRAVR